MNLESIFSLLGFLGIVGGGFLIWRWISGKKNNGNTSSGNIDSTVNDIANSVGSNRINSFLDKAKRLIQGIRNTDSFKGDSKTGSGGNPTDSNGDGK